MSLGHVAVVRPPACSGLACLLPWGAAAARVLRMLGLNSAANISRNTPEGWSQCYVGDVAWIQYGEKAWRVDVVHVCVSISLGFRVSPVSPASGFAGQGVACAYTHGSRLGVRLGE